ncbi:MAG: RNA polymerase factor sigma-54 [Bacteroidota bacterium]|nr:RNA polymerase factor sigma-54 [Bacteroidota bacterium]
MISNSLTTKLQTKFAPAQIQFMKLLQLPLQSLDQRIKEELEKNPVLEEDYNKQTEDLQKVSGEDSDDYNLSLYFQDDDLADYKKSIKRNNNENRVEAGNIFSSGSTFYEDLLSQLSMLDLSDQEKEIGKNIIGNIDENGYLTRSTEAIANDYFFANNEEISKQEVEKVLKKIQTFDPAGVGARDLRESLIIQLNKLIQNEIETKQELSPEQEKINHIALKILENHSYFEMFKNKQYPILKQKLKIENECLDSALSLIKSLNPKPAISNSNTVFENIYITPDFFVWNNDGRVEFQLNKSYSHSLKISSYYASMLEKYRETKKKNNSEKQAFNFIKEKMDSANEFISALDKREDTLSKVMAAIIKFQYSYFLEGDIDKRRPMRLVDISLLTGCDVSTISRVASNKYAQTHFGTFLLKDLFSNALEDSKGNIVSSDTVKSLIVELINNENKQKPLTDDKIVLLLKEKGYDLARRTVAKYRDLLNIPVARLRKTF